MSLDATHVKLTKVGTVTISPQVDGGMLIVCEGFEGHMCSCRDVAVLAQLWAIGELQKSLVLDIQKPGGGASAIG